MEMRPFATGELIIANDPLDTFLEWLELAKKEGVPEPTAMTLATAQKTGVPSARIVLCKGVSQGQGGDGRRGVDFFTNYESRKSQQLIENPYAALVFHWVVLRRQIRIEGKVERMSPEESNRYFQTRARGSQIGAWSSPQSKQMDSRVKLENLVKKNSEKFHETPDGKIPCPPFWGGWRVVPNLIEFWEERPFRLHERRACHFTGGRWSVEILAP